TDWQTATSNDGWREGGQTICAMLLIEHASIDHTVKALGAGQGEVTSASYRNNLLATLKTFRFQLMTDYCYVNVKSLNEREHLLHEITLCRIVCVSTLVFLTAGLGNLLENDLIHGTVCKL